MPECANIEKNAAIKLQKMNKESKETKYNKDALGHYACWHMGTKTQITNADRNISSKRKTTH